MKIERQGAAPISGIIKEYLKAAKLASGHNTQLIFEAWDKVSGAGKYSIRKFFRGGVLYVTLSSSVVRSGLQFQKEAIRDGINALLSRDDLFIRSDKHVGYVDEIILK